MASCAFKFGKAQVIGWDRGRPARNEREARKTSRLRRVAGGTPAVPANRLKLCLISSCYLTKIRFVSQYIPYENISGDS